MKNYFFYITVFLIKHSKSIRAKVIFTLYEIRRVLKTESEESIVMFEIYNKALKKKATKEEIKWANDQFQDILKTLGLGALLILPFAPITLPFLIKISKFFGVSLFPNSIKQDNKKEESEK